MISKLNKSIAIAAAAFTVLFFCAYTAFRAKTDFPTLKLNKNARIFLLGGNLGSRMMYYDHFETEMQLRYADSALYFRNMCDPGSSPGFRPNAGRPSPWAFPGAEKFQTELANTSEKQGHFETDDQWLTRLKADVIITFFGYSESFAGKEGLENYKGELDAFIKYTLSQKYNGAKAPQLCIVSPVAFEDLSAKHHLPDGKKINENLALYTAAKRLQQKTRFFLLMLSARQKNGMTKVKKI